MGLDSTTLTTTSRDPGQRADDWLVCPLCKVALWQSPDRVACAQCEQQWPVVDGIPHLVSDFRYWGEVPLEFFQRFA